LKKNPDYPGEIHSGCATALASVFAKVKAEVDALPGSGVLLYLTGHSLGAALATLCAQRLATGRGYPIQSLYTFGSPRVGNPEFAAQYQTRLGPRTYRLVNNEDLVTRVPPRSVGYEHIGEMVYIDDAGKRQRRGGLQASGPDHRPRPPHGALLRTLETRGNDAGEIKWPGRTPVHPRTKNP
jgi:predicted lipase